MYVEYNNNTVNNTLASRITVLVQLEISIFFYRNCTLKVQLISLLSLVSCKVLQSSNSNLLVGTFIEFNDLEDIRRMITQSLNA